MSRAARGSTWEASAVDVRPLADRLGAEVTGLGLSEELTWNALEYLKDALLDHKVLIFRGQHLDAPSHARLLRRFGRLEDRAVTAPGAWASPGSERLAPPKVVSLRATAASGGDPPPDGEVRVADTVGAYRDLPRPLRALADRSWVAHAPVRATQGELVAHPATRLHPETGDRGLLLGGTARHVLGLPDAESRTVLDLLQSYVVRRHNLVTCTLHPGDVLLADARGVQVRLPPGSSRLLEVTGEAPLGINGQHSHALPSPSGDHAIPHADGASWDEPAGRIA
jgi:taurine dioxygenase